MIDIENIVFNRIENAVRTAFPASSYPDLTVYGEYIEAPSGFPCVTIVESDNAETPSVRILNGNPESSANVSYDINIFTNSTLKKSLAKSIADAVDTSMRSANFRRTFRGQTPNMDRTIYRLTLRYSGRVSSGVTTGTGQSEHTEYLIYKS